MTYISAEANMESHKDAVEIIFLKQFLPCLGFAEEGQALTSWMYNAILLQLPPLKDR